MIPHLDLTAEQQAIQRGFLQIIGNLSERERSSIFAFFKAIVSQEFRYQGKGLNELHLNVLDRITRWEPKTSGRGIQRFSVLFIDYYTTPILQVLDYYQIDRSEFTPEHQSEFVRALIRFNLEGQGIKRDQKIQTLFKKANTE